MTRSGIETEYNGALYRSRLEARWAAMFDLLGIPFTYEPMDFNGYIPDFVLNGPRPVLVEVRPCISEDEFIGVAVEMEARVGFLRPGYPECRKATLEAIEDSVGHGTRVGDVRPHDYEKTGWPRDLLVLGVNAISPLEGQSYGLVAGYLGEFQSTDECECVNCEAEEDARILRTSGGKPLPPSPSPFAYGSPWWWESALWMKCETEPRHIGFVHDSGWYVNRPCGEYFGAGPPVATASEVAFLWSQAHAKTRWVPRGPWGQS